MRAECARPHGAPTAVAFSGGADSTALLLLMAAIAQRERPLAALCAIHVHHHLREAADGEAQSCAALCAQLSVPFIIRHVQPTHGTGGLAQRARTLRHAAIEEAATTHGAQWILMGHHADDALETLLMRLGRGTASPGLCGIPWVRRGWRTPNLRVARPLLRTTHAELVSFCDDMGVGHVCDVSNAAPSTARGLLRESVITPLRGRWGAIARHASAAADSSRAAEWALREIARRDRWTGESIERGAFRRVGPIRAGALFGCALRMRGLEIPLRVVRLVARAACDTSVHRRVFTSGAVRVSVAGHLVRVGVTIPAAPALR